MCTDLYIDRRNVQTCAKSGQEELQEREVCEQHLVPDHTWVNHWNTFVTFMGTLSNKLPLPLPLY